MSTPIESALNIGPTTAEKLRALGIESKEELIPLVAVECYRRLKSAFPRAINRNALWALQGAVLQLPYNQLPEAMKTDLLDAL